GRVVAAGALRQLLRATARGQTAAGQQEGHDRTQAQEHEEPSEGKCAEARSAVSSRVSPIPPSATISRRGRAVDRYPMSPPSFPGPLILLHLDDPVDQLLAAGAPQGEIGAGP